MPVTHLYDVGGKLTQLADRYVTHVRAKSDFQKEQSETHGLFRPENYLDSQTA